MYSAEFLMHRNGVCDISRDILSKPFCLTVAVLNPPSATASNELALILVWCTFPNFNDVKTFIKEKIILAKVVGLQITHNAYFTDDDKKIENQFPENGICRKIFMN